MQKSPNPLILLGFDINQQTLIILFLAALVKNMIDDAGETLRLKVHGYTGKIPGKLRFCAAIAISFFLFPNLLDAQVQLPPATEVYGKVVDATTKEPIPYANIRLSGSIKT